MRNLVRIWNSILLSTGNTLDGFPSLGAWVTYALGSADQSLPAYVAIPDPRGKPEIIWSVRGRQVCAELGVGPGHITLSDEAGLVVAVAVLLRA